MSSFLPGAKLPRFDFRPATAADIDQLAPVLASAFQDDPLTAWFVRHDAIRPMALVQLFRWYLREAVPGGLCDALFDPPAGAALWMGEGQWNVSVLRQILLLPQLVGVVGMRRLVSRLRGIDVLQRWHPHEPHYYLAVLGTHPSYQNQGIGSRLLDSGLSRCDRRGISAYLETANSRNLPFYERKGFRVTGTINIPFNGPLVWQMWREPH
jgi:ribosomal protein S18 acetylase RimI-like enzyme